MRKSSQQYDYQLDSIDHYRRFPIMRPFVGDAFATRKVKLLLIAESFYLPNQCMLHKDASVWYNSDESGLTASEKQWVHCRNLIECDWSAAGHFIYSELDRCLNESAGIGFESMAFMNAFQRPSCKEGESFKHFCTDLDIEKSVDVIKAVLEVLKPDQVIFVAKYPWDVLGKALVSKELVKKYDFVCHPATGGRYWHNAQYQHGRQKFLEIMRNANEQGD